MTPNTKKILTRHNAAPLNEFLYYARGIPMRHLCRMLQRHERTIKAWMAGESIIPPWAVAVPRLQRLEHQLMLDQMGITASERERAQRESQQVIQRRPAANDANFVVQLRLDMQS